MNGASAFTPRFLSATEYILALHEPEDKVAVLARNRSRGQTMQRILTAEVIASPQVQAWLMDLNSAGADIFVGMNPLKESGHCRTKENIREIRHVYLDLDENAGASLQVIRATGDVPAPNFVLDTSPDKHQVVWHVEGCDREQGESLLHSLANQFGGDTAATDATRVLRLPGFANRKYKDEFVVRVHHETDQVYSLRDFKVQEESPGAPRYVGDTQAFSRSLAQGHKSQSEADWAYAKRALARGDNPETVIQRIADYRSQDKADPNYYAHRTVTKAQADAQQRGALTNESDSRSPSNEHAH